MKCSRAGVAYILTALGWGVSVVLIRILVGVEDPLETSLGVPAGVK